MATETLSQVLSELPQRSITVLVLKGLDFVVPGQWDNPRDVEAMVRLETGETRMGRLQAIANHVDQVYADPKRGLQRATWFYRTADSSDRALALAAMAHMMGERVSLLSLLSKVTPRPDLAQSIDLGLKLAAEALAYLSMHGLPNEGLSEFTRALPSYGAEARLRMAALVALDGVLPLGPDFVEKVMGLLGRASGGDLEGNSTYRRLGGDLPGGDAGGRLGFVRNVFGGVAGWLDDFRREHDLTPDRVLGSIRRFVDVSDERMDLAAAVLDTTTEPFRHTGLQTVARHAVKIAAERFRR